MSMIVSMVTELIIICDFSSMTFTIVQQMDHGNVESV